VDPATRSLWLDNDIVALFARMQLSIDLQRELQARGRHVDRRTEM
jgi:hypothetical protein